MVGVCLSLARRQWVRGFATVSSANIIAIIAQWHENSLICTFQLPTMTPASASIAGGSNPNDQGSPAVATSIAKGPPSAIEFEPPLACVRRILKHTLPSSTNVGKDASAAFARASGIFIIYLTACANDFARENRRQTITANDVLAAIKVSRKSEEQWYRATGHVDSQALCYVVTRIFTQELEFDEFTPELTSFLERYVKTCQISNLLLFCCWRLKYFFQLSRLREV